MEERARRTQRKKRPSRFRVYYCLYLAVLAVAILVIGISVRGTLKQYDKSVADNYVVNLVKEATEKSELGKYLEKNVFSSSVKFPASAAQKESFYQTVKKANITAKLNKGSYDSSSPIFNIYADDKPLMTLGLKAVNAQTKLGILTISQWDIQSVLLRAPDASGTLKLDTDGTYSITVEAPDVFQVYINDVLLTKEYQSGEPTQLEQFQYIYDYVTMPMKTSYTIKGLTVEPTVVIKNNAGNEVAVKKIGTAYTAENTFEASQEAINMAEDTDPLNFGLQYSYLMTDDIGGASHGVNKVLAYIMPDSYLYRMTKSFASSVDITFVSGHRIDSITEKWVKNYVKYTDECFSCDVHFLKNMTLTRTGEKRTDRYYNRVYFAYMTKGVPAPGWYVVDTQALVE